MKKLFLIIGLFGILLGCNRKDFDENESIHAFNLSFNNTTIEDSVTAMQTQYCKREIQNIIPDILKPEDCNEFFINNTRITNKFILNNLFYIQVHGLNDFYIESDKDLIQDFTNFEKLFVKKYNSSYEVYMNTHEGHVFTYIGKLVLKSTVK